MFIKKTLTRGAKKRGHCVAVNQPCRRVSLRRQLALAQPLRRRYPKGFPNLGDWCISFRDASRTPLACALRIPEGLSRPRRGALLTKSQEVRVIFPLVHARHLRRETLPQCWLPLSSLSPLSSTPAVSGYLLD